MRRRVGSVLERNNGKRKRRKRFSTPGAPDSRPAWPDIGHAASHRPLPLLVSTRFKPFCRTGVRRSHRRHLAQHGAAAACFLAFTPRLVTKWLAFEPAGSSAMIFA